ncbi:MAG: hypothetical protein IJO64_02305 [Clostridia bacterium]|nr:hypothetical protein [Clostridia bacterium]
MKNRKQKPFTEEWELYEKGKEYNYSINLYETVNTNERFFRGDQWDNLNSGGLPTPVFNIFKRIIGYFTSSIMQTPIKMRYLLSNPSGGSGQSAQEAGLASEKLNRIADMRWEKNKMNDLLASALTDAAVSGDAVCYTYWDSDIRTGQAFTGDFRTVLIDNTNVFFGDPNSKNLQKQPYILIAQRETVCDLIAQAKRNGVSEEEIEKIVPDSETAEQSGDMARLELENTKCISLIKLWKDENGRVLYRKSVKNAVIKDTTETMLTLYPVAFFNWNSVKNSWHGQAVGTGLVDNQIFINKGFAMVMKHMMDTAFSKVVYDSTLLDGWSDRVGEAIAVNGPVDSVAKVISPGQMQSGMLEVLSMAIANTKEFLGATDAALGDVAPNNTSAILALQNASAVPLENVKRNLYQFVEDIGLIWLDFMFSYYDDMRLVGIFENGTERFESFSMSQFRNGLFDCRVDVGASSYWSEISSLNTLDNLLKLGRISTVQYLERLPDGLISDKERLIDEIKAASAAKEERREMNDLEKDQ